MPSLTQVIKIDVEDGKLRCERQAEYGYDTVLVELPAVISVGDAINEPRYPSLKAIMGAKKKPLETQVGRRRRHRGRPRRLRQRPRPLHATSRPRRPRRPARSSRTRTRTRRSRRSSPGSTRGSCWHERDPGLRAPLRGRLQQELARRRLRGRSARLRARHRVPRDRGRRQGRPRRRPASRRSAPTARRRSSASRAPRASRSRSSTRWPRSSSDNGHGYALFGGGLLGFEIGAGLAARLDAGVCMEVTEVAVEDGKLVAERPILQDSQISDVHYRSTSA